MEIKRGYVKWTSEDGVFHKEPLFEHPDLLASASPEEQLRAEEVRRLNEAASVESENREEAAEEDAVDTLEALREAPAEILTASALVGALEEAEAEPASAAEEPVSSEPTSDEALWSEDHHRALEQLKEATS